jgi:NAD-specific glutamate dehydrogenase
MEDKMLKFFADRVVQQIRDKAEGYPKKLLEEFAVLFLQAYPEALMSRYTQDELVDRVLMAYRFMERRSAGEIKLDIFWEDRLACILVLMEDQPFIVDTLNMQLESLGVPCELCIHPVLTIDRDEDGEVYRVASSLDDGPKESLVLFETLLE